MSETGRESLLRLRALARRFAAPLPSLAEAGSAEAAIERLVDGGLPLLGVDPLGGMGESARVPEAGHLSAGGAAIPGSARRPAPAAAAGSPRPRGTAAPSAPSAPRIERDPLGPPSTPPTAPVGLELVGGLLARIEGGNAATGKPQGAPPEIARGGRPPLSVAPPPRDRQRPVPGPVAADAGAIRTSSPWARLQLAGSSPAGSGGAGNLGAPSATASGSLSVFRDPPASHSPSVRPSEEPVGLGLVANLLAGLEPTAPAAAPKAPPVAREGGVAVRLSPAGGPPESGPALQRSAESPAARPAASWDGLAGEPPAAFPSPDPAAPAREASRSINPVALDPDLLADLVNDALVAQAVRFGVDLS